MRGRKSRIHAGFRTARRCGERNDVERQHGPRSEIDQQGEFCEMQKIVAWHDLMLRCANHSYGRGKCGPDFAPLHPVTLAVETKFPKLLPRRRVKDASSPNRTKCNGKTAPKAVGRNEIMGFARAQPLLHVRKALSELPPGEVQLR